MKFSSFKEFRAAVSNDIESVVKYLSVDLTKTLRELALGLTRLTFLDNFNAFSATVSIPTMTEVAIRNGLQGGAIPSYRLIVRGGEDSQNIVDGDTPWTQDYVYLKNLGAGTATATVIFIK